MRPAKANGKNTNNNVSIWKRLPFGKHKGKTLPQVICVDPSWFLWAVRESVFKYRHDHEVAILDRRIRGIKISKQHPEKWVVEYSYDSDRRFMEFDIVRRTDEPYLKHKSQSACLDLSLVQVRYAREWRNFIRDFRKHFFGGKNLTKKRCERFFSDRSHFASP
jgi:hypothetical protein